MTDEEHDVLDAVAAVASGDKSGRLTLTRDQCRCLCRMYSADPLYVQHDFPPELRVVLGRYANRRRNRQMNALLITYVYRASEDMVVLHVGRKMALGLLALLDFDVRDAAVKLADKWRRERADGKTQ